MQSKLAHSEYDEHFEADHCRAQIHILHACGQQCQAAKEHGNAIDYKHDPTAVIPEASYKVMEMVAIREEHSNASFGDGSSGFLEKPKQHNQQRIDNRQSQRKHRHENSDSRGRFK